MTPTIKFKRLHPNAVIPEYKTAGDSGLDLHWCGRTGQSKREWTTLTYSMNSGAFILWTGLSIEIPDGYEAQIRPRSSMSKRGVHCHLGTIDNGYRGDLGVCLQYLGTETFSFSRGDRIAQLVIAPVARCQIEVVETLSETERGAGGFGSTGK